MYYTSFLASKNVRMCRTCHIAAPIRTRVCKIDHQRTRLLVDLKIEFKFDLEVDKKLTQKSHEIVPHEIVDNFVLFEFE